MCWGGGGVVAGPAGGGRSRRGGTCYLGKGRVGRGFRGGGGGRGRVVAGAAPGAGFHPVV